MTKPIDLNDQKIWEEIKKLNDDKDREDAIEKRYQIDKTKDPSIDRDAWRQTKKDLYGW